MQPPLVAYRGLWDKFAAPRTVGALRRAYVRGVASLAWWDRGDLTVHEAVAVAIDRRSNPRRLPLFLIGNGLPPARHMDGDGTLAPDRLAIQSDGAAGEPWPMSRWTGAGWTPAGCYISAGLEIESLTGQASALAGHGLILVEASNVSATGVPHGDERDATKLAAIQQLAGARASVRRVSDLVEMEQLHRIRKVA